MKSFDLERWKYAINEYVFNFSQPPFMENMKRIKHTTELASDTASVLIILAILTLLYVLLNRIALKVLSIKLFPKETKKKQFKFVNSSWRLFNYSGLVAIGFYCLWNEDWVLNTYPKSYVAEYLDHSFPATLKFYYLVEFSQYIFSSIAIFFEPEQSDFVVMLIHHFATLFLILFSYYFGYHRIGVVVMLLHDVSDPLLELAKISLYFGKELFANVFFAIFASAFIFTRDYLFPVYIIEPILEPFYIANPAQFPFGAEFSIFLNILFVLHVFWTYLILKILMDAVFNKGVQGDIREDDYKENLQNSKQAADKKKSDKSKTRKTKKSLKDD